MTVAAVHIIGQDANGNHAEDTCAALLDDFISKTNLKTVYPSARSFGFNNPDAVDDDDPMHGFERWITIPDDTASRGASRGADHFEVPAPFVKKRLDGGIYAAHFIPVGAWDEGWLLLHEWVDGSKQFDFRWETIDGVCGWIEELLNYWNWNDTYDGKAVHQVDLLMPVKKRT
jgi:hypothetical protein